MAARVHTVQEERTLAGTLAGVLFLTAGITALILLLVPGVETDHRNWVVALDLAYRHSDSTRVSGVVYDNEQDPTPSALRFASGSSEAWFLAPAVEYNFSPRFGVIFGARLIRGRNTTTSVTPVVAFNYVH